MEGSFVVDFAGIVGFDSFFFLVENSKSIFVLNMSFKAIYILGLLVFDVLDELTCKMGDDQYLIFARRACHKRPFCTLYFTCGTYYVRAVAL